eukprot:CAMPEP_0197035918 /NCGR_PEP_ID=MMETSP1384-20130603/13574_1 /TAXON_ID=29189 /ORGANISM="Ammonia sp." /LENGTH=68 /DNA_ID=CAMNT_0042466029 /DNA_START=94 /DNA_END=300 /DNA_ORIENTATION=+
MSTHKMLKFYLDTQGNRVYTLKSMSPDGKATMAGHSARFTPQDKYSKQRIAFKQRFGFLPTQQPAPKY